MNKISISERMTIHKRTSNIDDNCTRFYHISCDEPNSSCCYNEYISTSRDEREVSGLRITARNGCSRIHSNEVHRFSNNIGSTDDNDMFAFKRYLVCVKKLLDPFWSTRHKSVRISEEKVSNICSSESINILEWIDRFNDITIDKM